MNKSGEVLMHPLWWLHLELPPLPPTTHLPENYHPPRLSLTKMFGAFKLVMPSRP